MDFETKVHDRHYENPLPYGPDKDGRAAYTARGNQLHEEFMTDLKAYLVENGVPAQYAGKAASYAWQEGHSSGYSEVFNTANNVLDIFS